MKRDYFVILSILGISLAFSAGFIPLSSVVAQNSSLPLGVGVLTTVKPTFQDSEGTQYGGIQYDETYHRQDLVEVLAHEKDFENLAQQSASVFPERGDGSEERPPLYTKESYLDSIKASVVFNRDDWAKDVRFNRDIWCLEFQYKPFRTMVVDLPDENGQIKPTQIWYLVYAVTNTGKTLKTVPNKSTGTEKSTNVAFPVQGGVAVEQCQCEFCQEARKNAAGKQANQDETKEPVKQIPAESPIVLRNLQGVYGPTNAKSDKGKYTWEWTEEPIQFIPRFILASDKIVENAKFTVDPKTGDVARNIKHGQVSYADQIIPLAVAEISKREKATKPFETTVSIAAKEIQPNETVWGVATWKDVDPRINFFSVHIAGLTNAYYWENEKDENGNYVYKKGDSFWSGRTIKRKVLTLNFWRLGDQYEIRDRQFRNGAPGELDYEWAYR